MPEATINKLNIEINADAKDSYTALDKVISRLDKLSKSADKANSSTKKISMKGKFDSLLSGLRGATRYFDIATDKMAEWFNESNEYIEAVNLFSVTMGKGAGEAKKYADSLQSLMGIDVKEWMSYQGSFNQIFTGYGIAEERANNMSQQLTQLTYDLSSLWNKDVQTAFQKVQSGMSGQIKGLKYWGINLSVARLKEVALAHGITLSTSKMTEAQKSMLRYIAIMESTRNVQGDLARTIITPANAMRILGQQVTQLKRALGNIVSVLVTKFIPYVQVAVKWLTTLAERVAKMFHFKLPEIDYSGLQGASDNADDLEEGLDDSNDAAKKLKKTLMGFDELNVLNAPADTSSTAVLGGGLPSDLGLGAYADSLGYDFTKGLENLDTSKMEETLIKIMGFLIPFGFAIGMILLFTGHIGLGIALIITSLAMVAAIIIMSDTISPKVKAMLTKILLIVGAAMLAIGVILVIAQQYTIGIPLIIAGVATLVSAVAINWNSIKDKIKPILQTLGKIILGIALLSLGVMLCLSGVGIPLGLILIKKGITEIQESGIDWDSLKKKIEPILKYLKQIIMGIGKIVIGIALLLTFVAAPLGLVLIKQGLTDVAGAKLDWNALQGKIKTVLATIKSIISAAEIVLGVILCLTGVGLPLGIALIMRGLAGVVKAEKIDSNPVTKAIKGVCNAAIGLVEDCVNKCIDLVNMAHFDFVLPAIMGGGTISVGFSNIDHVKIQRLATGGMVDKGQLFIAREDGAELVASMSGGGAAVMNNNQIVESVSVGVYRAVREAMIDNSAEGSGDINLNINIDGEPVYRNTVKRHNDEVKATGSSPLLAGV